jgi:hypothetical protein
MENEIEKKTTLTGKIFYILGSLLIVFMLYYGIMSLLAPAVKIKDINSEYGYKQPENSKTDERIFSDSAFVSATREKAYFQSRIAINLSDSSATLEINGVAVHKAKIAEIEVSKVFRKADEYSVSAMLSIPFTVGNDYATIMKEPMMLKIAPKDTSEYKPDILPDTTNSESVNYLFETETGTRIYFYQIVGKNEGGGLNLFLFDLNDRLRNFRDNLESLIRLKVPEYHPSIRLRLDKEDAKIIYRALPRHGQIAVYR